MRPGLGFRRAERDAPSPWQRLEALAGDPFTPVSHPAPTLTAKLILRLSQNLLEKVISLLFPPSQHFYEALKRSRRMDGVNFIRTVFRMP